MKTLKTCSRGHTFYKTGKFYSEKEILALHGMGKTSIPMLREALAAKGLAFKAGLS